MTKSMNYRLKFSATALVFVLFSACAASDDDYTAPSYASMYDGDSYRVICTGGEAREIYVRYNALDTFYRPDGTLKTRDEFCRENAVGVNRR